jgi:hypothetical protein
MPVRKGEPSGRCQVCRHSERIRIELLIAGGAHHRALARKYKVNRNCFSRHWARHVSNERKAALKLGPLQHQALAAQVSEEATSVIDHFRAVRAGLYTLYDAAVTAGDRSGGALLAGRLLDCLNSMARLTGELASSPLIQTNNNIFLMPEFSAVQAALVSVLARHPTARAEVIRAFRDLEACATAPVATSPTPRLIKHEPAK